MDQQTVFYVMVGMLLVTYLPRLLPMLLFTSRELPPVVVAWLRFVPSAVLSAMLLPSLVIVDNQLNFQSTNLYLWAAIPTFIVAVKTKNLFSSVIIGMAVVAVVRYLGAWA